MPFELIGECSSYLVVEDYMNLSISNRTIYCAANSPLTLKELYISNRENYEKLDLKRFKLIQSLSICPENFNEFEVSSYPKQHSFPRLNKLILFQIPNNIW